MRTGRPRNFDERDALAKVVETFRRRGFAGTSVEDLVSETGLSRSSLYGAFGGKGELFRRALSHYESGDDDDFLRSFFGEDGPADPAAAFVELWRAPYDPASGSCCLMQKTMFENAVVGGVPREAGLVGRHLCRFWDTLTAALRRRTDAREKPAPAKRPLSDEQKAAMLLAMSLGISVIARNGRHEALVDAVADGADRLLDG